MYPHALRGLLLWIAATGVYSPRWTERILAETSRNLIAKQRMSEEQWQTLAAALRSAFPEAEVDQASVDQRTAGMPNDEKDRHVLAAAVEARAATLVTNNIKDFKPDDLAKVGMRAASADMFLCELLATAPRVVRDALDRQAETMRLPRQWTVGELLGMLATGDPPLTKFVAAAQRDLGLAAEEPPPR